MLPTVKVSRLIPRESTVKSSNDDAHNPPPPFVLWLNCQAYVGMNKGRCLNARVLGGSKNPSSFCHRFQPKKGPFQRCALLPRSPNPKHASSSCTGHSRKLYHLGPCMYNTKAVRQFISRLQQIDNEGSKILSHLYVTDAILTCSGTGTQRKDIMSENKLIRFVHHNSVGRCPILVLENNSVDHVSFYSGLQL
jgi:hypothetical protein